MIFSHASVRGAAGCTPVRKMHNLLACETCQCEEGMNNGNEMEGNQGTAMAFFFCLCTAPPFSHAIFSCATPTVDQRKQTNNFKSLESEVL